MSQEILVSPDELREQATHVQGEADQARDMFSQLRQRLDGLADSFRGRAATRFDEKYNEWDAGANQLLDALDGLGQFLTASADAIEGVDEQLASGLG